MIDQMDRIRTCIGCGRRSDKRSFARISRTSDGTIGLDRTNRGPGRGAYVCSIDCLRQSADSKKINRALKCNVPEGAIDQIEESLVASGFDSGKNEE